jgi:glycosyltransferase involved in cell wall biosynthesis
MRTKPIFGSKPFGRRDRKLLLVAYFDPNGIDTIPQGIEAWQRLSRHEIVLLNMWPGRAGQVLLPEALELDAFDGIIVHPTVSYLPSTVETIDAAMKRGLRDFDGVKVLMKQDEQVLTGLLPGLIRDKGFDIVLTCVPPPEHEKVYPSAVIGDCTLVQVLTGYVSPEMRMGVPTEPRDLDVTYRGSIQPLAFGRLGYEKRGVGYDMANALSRVSGVSFDISSRWEDRFTGVGWEQFLARSKVILGVESGSNLFDFDGRVAQWCSDYAKRHQSDDATSYAYYKRAHDDFLHTLEGNVEYAQISPRHFEAAAAGAAQLLYEGRYSCIFRPGEHFFPLRRDLANLDEAIDFIRDDRAQRRMAARAYEEVILDSANWYETFVASADDAIECKLAGKGRSRRRSADRRPLAYVIAAHEPTIDPRIGWFASSLSRTHNVVVVGTYRFNEVGTGPSVEDGPDGTTLVRVERTMHAAQWLPSASELRQGKASQARALMAALVGYAAAPDAVLAERLGSHIAVASELDRFRTLCSNVVNTNSALLGAIERLGTPDLIVAAGLEALFAAITHREDTGCHVVFDAHEYWPYSFTDFQHWEIEFWSSLEARFALAADLRVTVSPQLADRMSREYGVPFLNLPNAATVAQGEIAGLDEAFVKRARRGPLRVLYQGGFAQGRGLEEVIQAWQHVRSGAVLSLRGPDNEYRRGLMRLVQALGLEGRVGFPDAVPESELVSAALEADIGLVPYNPAFFSYRLCCPNKLSQYAAAGLPVLSSTTEFVAKVVKDNEIGYVVDIADPLRVAAQVDELSGKRDELVAAGRRARSFFERQFNWDVLAAPVLTEMGQLRRGEATPRPDLSWIGRADTHGWGPSREASPLSPSVFGGRLKQGGVADFANAEMGAYVSASSPFHPRPNDADYLLRHGAPHGYAAALSDAPLPHWIEFDLGAERSVEDIAITWFREDVYPTDYRLLWRAGPGQAWRVLVNVHDNALATVSHKVRSRLRFIRLEASRFRGDPRLLMRSFRVLPASSDISGYPAGVPLTNVATAGHGAVILKSSPFFEAPNDPAAALGGEGDHVYAAALHGTAKPHWFEVDLGTERVLERIELTWYDDRHYARNYRLLGRVSRWQGWVELGIGLGNESRQVVHDLASKRVRQLRLEATEFVGQDRLLLKSLKAFVYA